MSRFLFVITFILNRSAGARILRRAMAAARVRSGAIGRAGERKSFYQCERRAQSGGRGGGKGIAVWHDDGVSGQRWPGNSGRAGR